MAHPSPNTRFPRGTRGLRGPLLGVTLLVLSSCGGAQNLGTTTTSRQATTTTAPITTTTTAPLTTTTTAAATTTTTSALNPGCTTGPTAIPDGASTKQVIDLDGDAQPDTAWISTDESGLTTVGIVTAAGGGTERSWVSASPVRRSVLVTAVNNARPPLFLADDGRLVQLWVFSDCNLVDATNLQGDDYEFSLGFGDIGTGVGCATVDGKEELVGLNIDSQSVTTVDWSSTVVTVTGTEARNGKITKGTFTKPADNDAIALLTSVACGSQTIDQDGLSAQQ